MISKAGRVGLVGLLMPARSAKSLDPGVAIHRSAADERHECLAAFRRQSDRQRGRCADRGDHGHACGERLLHHLK